MFYSGRSVDAAAYLPTSVDTHDMENHWRAILEFAQQGKPTVHRYMQLRPSWREAPQERKLDPLLDPLEQAHLLRVSRLSRMGRSAGGSAPDGGLAGVFCSNDCGTPDSFAGTRVELLV